MDWNRVEGDWKRLKGNAKEQWGRLTEDDLAAINGRREQLEGKLQGDSVYTSARTNTSELRPMARRRTVVEHLRELGSYRELLVNLTRKELTVRYQHSVLGFAWSMLQPVFLLVVYTIVFRILGAGFAKFSIWVLCGLLIWTFVSSSLLTATKSITENYSLVGKVKFPRAVLPLSSVASALVHLGLQSVAFAVAAADRAAPVDWEYMWLVPFAVFTAMLVDDRPGAHPRPAQRLRPRHDAPAGAADPRLVLGDADPLPVRAGGRLPRRQRPPPVAGARQPADARRDHDPAGDLRQRSLARATIRHALLPGYGPLWYLEALAITAAGALVLCWIALKAFDRAEVNLVEAL